MGAQQAGLLATDIFREIGQERVKISCKCPDIAFVSNSPRKDRQGLGMKLRPGMWLVCKSHLNLSLGFFLLHILSNPPHPRLSVLVHVVKSQPGKRSNSLT